MYSLFGSIKRSLDLRVIRNRTDASYFYLANLLTGLMAGAIFGFLAAVSIAGSEAWSFSAAGLGRKLSRVFEVVYVLVLGYAIYRFRIPQTASRNRRISFFSIVIISGLLARYGGVFFGLLPLAYLTTRMPEDAGGK